jgi:hypothetical protein
MPPRKVWANKVAERQSRRTKEKNPEERVLIVNRPLNWRLAGVRIITLAGEIKTFETQRNGGRGGSGDRRDRDIGKSGNQNAGSRKLVIFHCCRRLGPLGVTAHPP